MSLSCCCAHLCLESPGFSALWDTPNVFITPHVATPTIPAVVSEVLIDNVMRYCDNLSLMMDDSVPLREKAAKLLYSVDFDAGY